MESGDDDLAAVTRSADACGAVDVDADVPLVGASRLAGVQAHAHPDRPAGERLPAQAEAAATASIARREGIEEGVALRVDLEAVRARRTRLRRARRWSARSVA